MTSRTGSWLLIKLLKVFSAVIACILLLPSVLPGAEPGTPPPLSYADLLGQLTDLDRLTHLQTGFRGGLFSSWDRNSRNVWGANGDAGQYLRVEPNGEAVMMDIDGPGVVYRIWSANPMGKIRVYLDGAESPTFEWNFPDLFDGNLFPFVKPLVYRRDDPQSASDCYLPIPFAKHIKITADKAHGEYYHFNYVLYPKDKTVASFRLPLAEAEQIALTAAARAWSLPGRDPKPKLVNQETIARNITLEPGQSIEICSVKGTAMIRAIRARVQSDQRYAWRKLVLRCTWDNARQPQVESPLGPFFGFDWETAEYGSVPVGCLQSQAYNYFPMPFKNSASLTLTSYLEQPATIEYEIEWAPAPRLPDDFTYFYARWRHEPDIVNFEYSFLETAGRGHFVGVSMPIDHPLPGWWGEGDEKVWVDDDQFPPYIGTGSEDYFGDAWGIRYLSGPSYGASSAKGHRTCNYRWHFMDFIPFAERMRMTIENYGPNGQGPRGQYDYSSTAFWYQAELEPPFEKLRGATYVGADTPDARPAKMEYNAKPFAAVTAESLRTYGLGITFAQQAETLMPTAKIITDATRKYEFDRERAVDFGKVAAGQVLGELKLPVAADGVYQVSLYTAPEQQIAELSLLQNGKALPIVERPQPHILRLAHLFLTAGEHAVTLAAVTSGQGIFDCLQLQSVPRVSGAIEAEELAVVRTLGGAAVPKPSEPMNGVSAGRTLEFHSDREGQGFVLNLGKRPAQPYVLGVRPIVGPKSAMIRAFVNDRPIGPKFDLFASKREPGSSILPLGEVPAGATEVQIRVVGKHELSQGGDVELDYFRWEPSILGPGTAEGIWAEVVATKGCEYRPQDLGGNYSGGHQFWVQPSSRNAYVDIALHVPRAGNYSLQVKYTKSWDYAIVQASLDDQKLGEAVDTYAPSVAPAEPLTLGQMRLDMGKHILRFQAVDKNAESKGYLMGIDHVVVRE